MMGTSRKVGPPRGGSEVYVTGIADGATFVRLLKPLQASLQRYARRMLRDQNAVEDVLQESALAAFARFSEFTPGTNFRAWMFKFVTLQSLKANRRTEPVSLEEIPADLAVEEAWQPVGQEEAFGRMLAHSDEFLDLLEAPLARVLLRLSAAERACLLLKSIGEFTYQEIHELLDIPTGSVMGYLSRARRRMRLYLGEQAAERGWMRKEASLSNPAAPDDSSSGQRRDGP